MNQLMSFPRHSMNETANAFDPLHRPIIILGAPRSGTTFLGDILGVHRDLAYLVEPRLVWRYGNDAKSDMLRREDAREEVCRHIRGSFANFVRRAGRRRLLEKTPSNSLRPAFVDAVFPDCLFIHIMRSPIDSVLSIRRLWLDHASGIRTIAKGRVSQRAGEISPMRLPYYWRELVHRFLPRPVARLFGQNIWGPRLPAINCLLQEVDLLDVCALQWRSCIESTKHFGERLPEDRYLEIRLEDLSDQHLGRLFEFCGIDSDSTVWERFHRDHDPSLAHARRARAQPQEIDRILEWIEPTMRWIGYDLP